MQFGDPKRITPTVITVTVVAALVTIVVFAWRHIPLQKCIVLFLSLEGTGFLAGAFSASGQLPPQGSLISRIRSFFEPQRAVPVHYSPALFYGGLLLLATLCANNSETPASP